MLPGARSIATTAIAAARGPSATAVGVLIRVPAPAPALAFVLTFPETTVVGDQSQLTRRRPRTDPGARRGSGDRMMRGFRAAMTICHRARDPVLGTVTMLPRAMRDVVHRDAGGQCAGGDHGAQLHHQRTARAGAGPGQCARSGAGDVAAGGRPEPQCPNHRIRQHGRHGLAQRRPCPVHELADRTLRQPHPRGDPCSGHSVQGGADQSFTLRRRQLVEL